PPPAVPRITTVVSYTASDVEALRVARHVPADVVLVPPWAIARDVLDDSTRAVLVAFPGDPHSAAALSYLASTGDPTGTGYLTWLSTHGLAKPRLRLVAVGAGQIFPGHDHRHSYGWLAHAPLVPVD
ncbi:MAG: hypothetical protein QOI47_2385, partial [Actinomycetota bacterium]|nr:hypothetical protein [Actinomycetota bacterium]